MSIEKLYPYAGDHAVQNAVFVVEWAEHLKADAIVEASKLASKFRNLGLPDVQHQNMLEVKIEALASGNQQIQNSQGVGAITFSRKVGLGESARCVTISRQNCMIVIPDYTRWATVLADIQSYLKIVLEEIAPIRPLSAIGIQIHDTFSWKDDPSELNLKEVFAENTYIPANVFQQSGLWHLHHGYIETHSSPLPHSRLENINVDMVETGGERAIQIVGSHRASLTSPLWQSHLKNKPQLIEMFEALHAANKQMLGKLLTKEVCDRIKLNT